MHKTLFLVVLEQIGPHCTSIYVDMYLSVLIKRPVMYGFKINIPYCLPNF